MFRTLAWWSEEAEETKAPGRLWIQNWGACTAPPGNVEFVSGFLIVPNCAYDSWALGVRYDFRIKFDSWVDSQRRFERREQFERYAFGNIETGLMRTGRQGIICCEAFCEKESALIFY